jgi:hypothetical protein
VTGKPDPKPKAETPAPPTEGRFKRALGQAREAAGNKGGSPSGADGNGDGQAKPGPKRPPPAGGGRPSGAGGLARAQPSGSQPRPKKRRR